MSESPSAQNMRDVGSVVANRYTLVRHLGSGRYGEIYEAVDRSLSGSVALHLLSDRVAQQTRLLQKLESSYQQPHTWSHANIVKIRGFGTDAGRYFVVMEWLEGDTLRSLLDENPEQPPSEAEALSVVRGIGDALKYAHAKGAIHGDIRPQKIFLTTSRAIKVLDLLPGTSPRSGLFFVEDASPTSLAPPDQRDDVYGLACVAYELLTGKHPFDGRSPRVASSAGMTPAPIPGLGAQRWAALARGLALRREQRTPNVAVFLVELGVASSESQRAAKPAAEKRPPAAAPSSPPPAAAPTSQPRRKEPPPILEKTHARDDDMPIIGDFSGTYPGIATSETQPQPERRPEPAAPPPAAADNTWRIDPRDMRRHGQPKRKRGPEPGDLAFRLGGLLIGGLVAFAIFSNYDTLRDRVAGWIDVTRNGPAQIPSALPERQAENETIEVQAPTVVPTPDLPPESPGEAAVEPPAQDAQRVEVAPVPDAAPVSPGAAPSPDAAGVAVARAPAVAGVEAQTELPADARESPAAEAVPTEAPPEPARPVEPETFAFASSVVTVSEGQPGARVTIRRRGGAGGESSVVWWTSDGAAVAGEDYANLGRSTEKFGSGEETRTILVPIIGDAKAEGRESFYVNLGDPSRPDSREPAERVEVVIEDDD